MDFFEAIYRIWSFVIALGLFALTFFLIGMGWAGIVNGVPLIGTFIFAGIIMALFGLGLIQYAFTGDYVPPWGWWWDRA